jgi:hypothetical protein
MKLRQKIAHIRLCRGTQARVQSFALFFFETQPVQIRVAPLQRVTRARGILMLRVRGR